MSLSLANGVEAPTVERRLFPMIQSALDAGGGHLRVADVLDSIARTPGAEIHPGHDSFWVTRIMDYPLGRTLRFELGGGNVDELILMEAFLSAHAAKHQGAQKSEIIGRPGWQRSFPEYRKLQVHLLRDL